jgi:hypothetical protein
MALAQQLMYVIGTLVTIGVVVYFTFSAWLKHVRKGKTIIEESRH